MSYRQKIVEVLTANPRGLTRKEISERTGVEGDAVSRILWGMKKKNLTQSGDNGLWRMVSGATEKIRFIPGRPSAGPAAPPPSRPQRRSIPPASNVRPPASAVQSSGWASRAMEVLLEAKAAHEAEIVRIENAISAMGAVAAEDARRRADRLHPDEAYITSPAEVLAAAKTGS